MNAFTVIEQRGAIVSATSLGRASKRGGDYDEARGPRGNRPGAPRDLARSRRVGLSRTVCADCRAVKDEGYCQHENWCLGEEGFPGGFRRETTGPLTNASPLMQITVQDDVAHATIVAGGAVTADEAGWK
jgi:hypothetical protein